MYPEIDAIEKEQVEWVFALTGGELEDKPLRVLEPKRWQSTGEITGEHGRWWVRYWYQGAPDYAPDIERKAHGDVITIVWDRIYAGVAPDTIRAKGREWRKVADFGSSGEGECPGNDCDDPPKGLCPLCETDHAEERGYIYVGDGWFETVYEAC